MQQNSETRFLWLQWDDLSRLQIYFQNMKQIMRALAMGGPVI